MSLENIGSSNKGKQERASSNENQVAGRLASLALAAALSFSPQ